MACFTLPFLEHILLMIVVIAAVVAVIGLLVPWVFSMVGVNLGPLPQIVRIIVGAIIAIAVIYFVFDLLSCLRW